MPQIASRIGLAIRGLSQVDSDSWNAAEAGGGTLDGRIVNCCLDHNGVLYWADDFPVDVAIGDQIRAHFTFTNTGDITGQFYYMTEIIDPNGIIRISAEGNNPCDPDWQKASTRTSYVTIDKRGTWIVHGILEIMV